MIRRARPADRPSRCCWRARRPASAHALLEGTSPQRGASLDRAPRAGGAPLQRVGRGRLRRGPRVRRARRAGPAGRSVPSRRRPARGRRAVALGARGRRLHRHLPRDLGGLASGLGRLRVRRREGGRACGHGRRPARGRQSRAGHLGRVLRRPRAPVRGDRARRRRADPPARGLAARARGARRAGRRLGGGRGRVRGALARRAARRRRGGAAPRRCSGSCCRRRSRRARRSGTRSATRRDVLSTRFGTVWGLGALAWLAVCALALPARAAAPAVRPATVGAAGVAVARAGWWTAALAVPLAWLVLLPALGGHAGVQAPVAVLLPANVIHVIAASAWIGGLALLVLALPAAAAAARAARPHTAADRRGRALLGAGAGRRRAAARGRDPPVGPRARRARRPLGHGLRARDHRQERARARAARVGVSQPPPHAAGARARGGGGRVARPTRPHAAARAPRRGRARRRGAGGHRRPGRLLAVERDRDGPILGVRRPRPGARRAHRRARRGGAERGPPVPLQALGREPVGRGARDPPCTPRCRRRAARRSRSTRARPDRATTSSAALRWHRRATGGSRSTRASPSSTSTTRGSPCLCAEEPREGALDLGPVLRLQRVAGARDDEQPAAGRVRALGARPFERRGEVLRAREQ